MSIKKVLVVDDEIHIIHVVAIKLRNNGFDVISAANGLEAYEKACMEKPDIIVTDYQMPIMNGMQLVEKLGQNSATRGIPVILLTARGFAIEDHEKQNEQIRKFLSKPFSPRELLNTIDNILAETTVKNQG